MAILEISNLQKSYGSQMILDSVSFSVPKGSVYGFIGKNGVGKTTTMNIALGLLKADKGEVLIQGENVRYGDTKTNRLIGYLPDVPEFYSFLTAREYLALCFEINGIKGRDSKNKINELLELVGLEDTKKRMNHYSRGMKQRLGIAQALVNNPPLLICDEPTSALDPVGRKQVLSVLEKVKEHTTVIFSTHILTDVESICDHVAILDKGRVVKQGTVTSLKNEFSSEKWGISLETKKDTDKVFEALPSSQLMFDIKRTSNRIEGRTLDSKRAIQAVISVVNELSVTPVKIERKEATIEEVFLEAIK